MKALFVAWQEPETRRWLPVGRLTHENGKYKFVYTRGAKEAKSFTPFGRMVDLDAAYVSDVLFPLFANRVLPKSRPEYGDYMRWLGLREESPDELEILARSGGARATDTLEIIPCPEPTMDKNYEVYFFSHGVRHLKVDDQAHIKNLRESERLYLMRDLQNEHDAMALLLRTADPISCVGYCPRYYSGDFSRLLTSVGAGNVHVTVEQINPDAPTQLRLLCKLVAPWPAEFSACALDQYQPLAS